MELSRQRGKKIITAGAIAGALLAITVALLMDVIYADALQGTWRDAIAHDLGALLSLNVSPDSILVYGLFLLVLLFLGSFGAFLGMVFSFIVYRFLSFLGS
jgi:hypothetical protein